MKIKQTLITIISLCTLLYSCGKTTVKTKEDAIKFLESNSFYDDGASISGKSGGSLKSGFTLTFENGKAIIDGESMDYTISDKISNGNAPGYNANYFNGFEIEFCGSERYAYGGCIKAYLSTGESSKDGASLTVRGDYVKAYFSYITKGAITKK